jgi:hypothetical protein
MVFETLVFSPLNHLNWLIAQENFIILSRQESIKHHLYLPIGKVAGWLAGRPAGQPASQPASQPRYINQYMNKSILKR